MLLNTKETSSYRNKVICFLAALLLAVLTITAVLKGGGVSPGELAADIRNLSIPELSAVWDILQNTGEVLYIQQQTFIFLLLHPLHPADNRPVLFL